jgi:hypothetical protein
MDEFLSQLNRLVMEQTLYVFYIQQGFVYCIGNEFFCSVLNGITITAGGPVAQLISPHL